MTASVQRWFMAGVGPTILQGGVEGAQDGAVDIPMFARSNPIAPAGMGGECIFGNLYLTVTHSNPTLWPITLQPLVDEVLLAAVTVEIPAVAPGTTVKQTFELALMQPYSIAAVERLRYAPRGEWIEVQLLSVDAPDGRVVFDGVELEYDVVREGKAAANA